MADTLTLEGLAADELARRAAAVTGQGPAYVVSADRLAAWLLEQRLADQVDGVLVPTARARELAAALG